VNPKAGGGRSKIAIAAFAGAYFAGSGQRFAPKRTPPTKN
jgi:hypothetical protein